MHTKIYLCTEPHKRPAPVPVHQDATPAKSKQYSPLVYTDLIAPAERVTTRQYEKLLQSRQLEAARDHAQSSHAVATDHLAYLADAQQLHEHTSRHARGHQTEDGAPTTRSRARQSKTANAQVRGTKRRYENVLTSIIRVY